MPYQHNPHAVDLSPSDLYLVHRAHLAVDALVGDLGRRWGPDSTTVLLLRAAAGEMRDVLFAESTPGQRDIIGAHMRFERNAIEVMLRGAVAAMQPPKPG